MVTKTINADTQDELDDALDQHKADGWHVHSVTRRADGQYIAELRKDD